jgi:hypothetical protein
MVGQGPPYALRQSWPSARFVAEGLATRLSTLRADLSHMCCSVASTTADPCSA